MRCAGSAGSRVHQHGVARSGERDGRSLPPRSCVGSIEDQGDRAKGCRTSRRPGCPPRSRAADREVLQDQLPRVGEAVVLQVAAAQHANGQGSAAGPRSRSGSPARCRRRHRWPRQSAPERCGAARAVDFSSSARPSASPRSPAAPIFGRQGRGALAAALRRGHPRHLQGGSRCGPAVGFSRGPRSSRESARTGPGCRSMQAPRIPVAGTGPLLRPSRRGFA